MEKEFEDLERLSKRIEDLERIWKRILKIWFYGAQYATHAIARARFAFLKS